MFFRMVCVRAVGSADPPYKKADRGRCHERDCRAPAAKFPQAVEYISEIMIVRQRIAAAASSRSAEHVARSLARLPWSLQRGLSQRTDEGAVYSAPCRLISAAGMSIRFLPADR